MAADSTSGSGSGATSEPPLSSIPPPTLARPTAPPTSPSDQIKPRTLLGAASRYSSGCVVLATDVGPWELVGDGAAEALKHSRVAVSGVARPELVSSCGDIPVFAVRQVAAAT